MKQLNLILGLVIVMALGACSKKNEESSISAIRGSGARGNTSESGLTAENGTWFPLQSPQLDAATKSYVSSFMDPYDPNNFGSVTGLYSNYYGNNYNPYQSGFNNSNLQSQIGVYVRPMIRMVNGTVDMNGSMLAIKVVDTLVGQLDANGKTNPAIPVMAFANAQSKIQTQNGGVELVFTDSYGSVSIQLNSVGNRMVQGTVRFANTRDFSGAVITPQWQDLGQFSGSYDAMVTQY